MRALPLIVVLAAACGSQQSDAPVTALDRAKQAFGPKHSVSGSGITVPGGKIFTAIPDPVPADYDGFSALLVADSGELLNGPDAVRFAWDQGVRDAAGLAPIAALFVGRAREVATEEHKHAAYITGRELIQPPAIADGKLVFWVVRGSMSPTAEQVIVDLTTFEAVAP